MSSRAGDENRWPRVSNLAACVTSCRANADCAHYVYHTECETDDNNQWQHRCVTWTTAQAGVNGQLRVLRSYQRNGRGPLTAVYGAILGAAIAVSGDVISAVRVAVLLPAVSSAVELGAANCCAWRRVHHRAGAGRDAATRSMPVRTFGGDSREYRNSYINGMTRTQCLRRCTTAAGCVAVEWAEPHGRDVGNCEIHARPP